MLYTRTGDNGTSGLFGTKERLSKTSLRYEALGTLDELNSLLGYCYAVSRRAELRVPEHVPDALHTIQQHLFCVQAELAGAEKHLADTHVALLEDTTDRLEIEAGNPHRFVVPGASELSALLDVARAVARRAERAVLRVVPDVAVGDATRQYLNRLSSTLYALARYTAAMAVHEEAAPHYE